MEKPATKAEMLRDFHVMLGVTCENCKRSESGYGYNIVKCNVLRMTVSAKDYCSCWEDKNERND